MNNILKALLKVILFLILLVILTFFGQFVFAYLYFLIGGGTGTWIGTEETWSQVFGTMFAYLFFTIFLADLMLKTKKRNLILAAIGILNFLIVLYIFQFDNLLLLVICFALLIFGYLLAELIKFLQKKLSRR